MQNYKVYSDEQILKWFIKESELENDSEIQAFATENNVSIEEAVKIAISDIIDNGSNPNNEFQLDLF
jgi:predicted HTH domain antitoxin